MGEILDQCSKFIYMIWLLTRDRESPIIQLEEFITILWGLWTNQNETCHGNLKKTGDQVIRQARRIQDEFQEANCRSPVEPKSAQEWTLHPLAFVKVNVDGATFT